MSHKRIVLPLLVLCGMAGACLAYSMAVAPDPPISLEGVPLEVMFYQKGRPARVGTLPADSAGVAAIEALLTTKTGRWWTSFVTYIPYIYIRSNKFRINIHNNRMIVNYEPRKGKYRQVVSELTDREFDRVSRAISESFTPNSDH